MPQWSKLRSFFLATVVGLYIGTNTMFITRKMDCLLSENGTVFPSMSVRSAKDEQFLFIGVMTVRQNLDSRARAINMTWAQDIPGKVVFFVGDGKPYEGDLDVVVLEGVAENDYPPQRKSFAMLQYIYLNYGDAFEWYIRADDDAYFKARELTLFLKSINNSGHHYIGQPGFGKREEKDIDIALMSAHGLNDDVQCDFKLINTGKLGLSGAFCMGGPGVIMSPKLLRDLAPNLRHCLNETATAHEDTELGRCVWSSTGGSCVTAFDFNRLFYQNYEELKLPNSSFKKVLGKSELDALTLHPVKVSAYVYRLDNFFSQNKLLKLKIKRRMLRTEIATLPVYSRRKNKISSLYFKHVMLSAPRDHKNGTALKARSKNPEVIKFMSEDKKKPLPSPSWDFLRTSQIYSWTLDIGKLMYPMKYKGRQEMHIKHINAVRAPDKLPVPLGNSEVLNITRQKLSADKGSLGLVYAKKATRVEWAFQPYLVHQPFGKVVAFRESSIEPGTKAPMIYMLLPIYQRSSVFQKFLDNYAKAAVEYDGQVKLVIAMFRDNQDEHLVIRETAFNFMRTYPFLAIFMVSLAPPFNRGKGLMAAVEEVPESALLVLMDVDMEFSSHFLNRARMNTVEQKTAYFPIYFVHYDPESICYGRYDCDELMASKSDQTGRWRSFSFGIVSIYKSDLLRAGGFRRDIEGWGWEDIDVYEKCLAVGLSVMRTADPGLTHKHHPRDCDPYLSDGQLRACLDSANAMLGSVKVLTRMFNDLPFHRH